MSSMSQSSSHSIYRQWTLRVRKKYFGSYYALSPLRRLQRSGLSTLKCFRLLSWTAFMLSAWPVWRGFSTSAPQKDPRREADYSDNGHLRTSMSSSCVKCLVSSSVPWVSPTFLQHYSVDLPYGEFMKYEFSIHQMSKFTDYWMKESKVWITVSSILSLT